MESENQNNSSETSRLSFGKNKWTMLGASAVCVSLIFLGVFQNCSKTSYSEDFKACDASEVPCDDVNTNNNGNVDDPGNGGDGGTDPSQKSYDVTFGGRQVDILFVDDNSASMSFEQTQVANRFSSLLSQLDLYGIDYRIGVVTTDVSSPQTASETSPTTNNPTRAINGNGALQDGKLIRFDNGTYFLDAGDTDKANHQTLFAKAIRRPETSTCETFLKANPTTDRASQAYKDGYYANCPSSDERGIYASILALTNNASFAREGAHFSVVLVSDEDERSSYYALSDAFRLSSKDLPSFIMNKMKSLSKSFTFHSIIVRPGTFKSGFTAQSLSDFLDSSFTNSTRVDISNAFEGGDSVCLKTQSEQVNKGQPNAVSGSYAYIYSVLTRLTGGVEADICSTNYASPLVNIGQNIANKLNEYQLACSGALGLTVTMTPSQGDVTWTVQDSKLIFSRDVDDYVKVRVQYRCP